MSCVAAPALLVEASRAKSAGCKNMGIVGDLRHTYGFHVCAVGAGDYSLESPKNRPVGAYACALDTRNDTGLGRAYAKRMFEACAAGWQPVTQAEFIGSWDGTNVWYWNWKQGRRIEKYRGSGHNFWCHQSCFRSQALKDGGWWQADSVWMGGSDDSRAAARKPTAAGGGGGGGPAPPVLEEDDVQTTDIVNYGAERITYGAWLGKVSGKVLEHDRDMAAVRADLTAVRQAVGALALAISPEVFAQAVVAALPASGGVSAAVVEQALRRVLADAATPDVSASSPGA